MHRLDRETSGCLLIAKRRRYLLALHELIRCGDVFKSYLLVARDRLQSGKMVVNLPLTKNTLRSGERVVRVDDAGKPASTKFRLLDAAANCCLMEARLITGRTHQIRVHASASGHPIAGDEKYGDKEFNQLCRTRGLNRMFLHASQMRFQLDDQCYDLHSPLPAPLRAYLKHLGLQVS